MARLTKSDLNAIEAETVMLAGTPPSLDTLHDEGFHQNDTLIALLDGIAGIGRVVTLVVAEMIQSAAALIIAVVFAVMEYQRVEAGALALGQASSKAGLIAFAVVCANIVHPIYSLRALKGKRSITVTKMTGRGYWDAFWNRLTGQPTTTTLDTYHNATLHTAAAVITWSTILLAVYDILSPLLTQMLTNTLTRPAPIAVMELVMGLGLSIAGVFFLQSASHEIGVRTLVDQPEKMADVLAIRRAEYNNRVDIIRQEVRERYMQAKQEETTKPKKGELIVPVPFGVSHHDLVKVDHDYPTMYGLNAPVNGMQRKNGSNGNGHN